ncbi:MAG: FAD-dependent oxidoreductase [Acidobacteria bacterium]|nr:FAD-dependent oxidoreductase [Acidobacteriota bacterium]
MAVVTVPLANVLTITPRSRLVRIDVARTGFQFQPGQAVLVGTHGQSERRPYSIASSPDQTRETGLLDLLIAVEQDGGLGSHFGAGTPGTVVDIEGPLGSFTLAPPISHKRILLVAGGTGIAPLRSMLDHMLRQLSPSRISLLYSARRSEEFAFIDEFRRHAAAGVLELHQTVTRDQDASWSGQRGRIGRSHFEAVLHDPADTLCFVCGPELFVAESVATLKALGVPDAQIRTEQWAAK